MQDYNKFKKDPKADPMDPFIQPPLYKIAEDMMKKLIIYESSEGVYSLDYKDKLLGPQKELELLQIRKLHVPTPNLHRDTKNVTEITKGDNRLVVPGVHDDLRKSL